MAATENLDISDEAKKSLQNQVEELIFVENYFKLKGFMYCACKKLAIVHFIANCRDVYCNNCYLEYYKQTCPSCKETVQTKEQHSEFEREVFRFKVECKFKKNGCEEIVELRNFLDHILVCKYSTGKLLPKLYRNKEDPIADALQQLNGDDNPIKQVMELMHTESRRILNEIHDLKISVKDNMELQADMLKKLADEFHNKETDELQQLEIMQIKDVYKEIKEMQEENNREIRNIKEQITVLTDKVCKNNNATEQMKAKIMQLKATQRSIVELYNTLIEKNYSHKEALKKNEEASAALQKENNSQFKNIEEIHNALIDDVHTNINATELQQKEVMLLKDALKKHEEAGRALHKENNSQFKNIEEIHNALIDDVHTNMNATELQQKEVMLLKDALKKHEEAGSALQKENNSKMKKIEENNNVVCLHFKFLLNDNVHKNKNANELLQKELILIKESLKKSEKAAKELLLEHNGELQKIESQQRLHLGELQNKLSTQFRNELTEFRYLQEGALVILWKIAGFQEKLRNLLSVKDITIRSEEFFIINDGLKFKPILLKDSEGEVIHINLEFIHNLADKSDESLPYLHSRKYILLDQSNALEKYNIELIDRPHFDMNSTEKMMLPRFNYSLFFPIRFFKGENRYLKIDNILIKIILKPISFLYKNVASSDGTLLWRIDNYSKKKRAEIDGFQTCLISKPFKTSQTGYLIQVELHLNGFGSDKGQFLSIYSRIIMGENDANLPCTFNYKCSFYLMDQSDSLKNDGISNHAQSFATDQTNLNWGFPQFILQSQAEDPKYRKGDSLLIKVVVQFF